MSRVNNWPSALNAQIEAARALPFAWGSHDCCLWPATVAFALTMRDPAAYWRGKYTTAREAVKMWRGYEGRFMGLVNDGCESVGFEPATPVFAQRGDIIVAKQGARHIAGVCIGREFAAVGATGLVFKPMADAVLAWRVE
jgi:hypothetical protein